ncbi:MAG: transporter, partial [Rhizobacter sp.]|nr:transporter [Rhizobacter sp.]
MNRPPRSSRTLLSSLLPSILAGLCTQAQAQAQAQVGPLPPPALPVMAPAPPSAALGATVAPVVRADAAAISGTPSASAPNAEDAARASSALRGAMKDLVKQALAYSPALRQNEAEWRSTIADVEQAEGQRLPQVSLQLASPGMQVGEGAYTGIVSSKPSIGMSASLTVWDWGYLTNLINSRSQAAISAQAKYQLQAETTAFETASAVLQIARYRQLVDAGDAYVTQMRKFTAMLREIVQADRGRLSELTQARSRALQADLARDASVAKVREFEVALRRQVGEQPPVLPKTVLDIDLGLPQSLTEAILRSADHPQIRQAEAEAISADYQSRAVRAGELPAVNWVVSKSTAVDSLGRRVPLQ